MLLCHPCRYRIAGTPLEHGEAVRNEPNVEVLAWRTFQLLVQLPSTCDAEGTYKLLKVYCSILILIKDVENMVGKVCWVTKRKELLVNPTELGFVELA